MTQNTWTLSAQSDGNCCCVLRHHSTCEIWTALKRSTGFIHFQRLWRHSGMSMSSSRLDSVLNYMTCTKDCLLTNTFGSSDDIGHHPLMPTGHCFLCKCPLSHCRANRWCDQEKLIFSKKIQWGFFFLRWMTSSKGCHRNLCRVMQKGMGSCEVKCRQEQESGTWWICEYNLLTNEWTPYPVNPILLFTEEFTSQHSWIV